MELKRSSDNENLLAWKCFWTAKTVAKKLKRRKIEESKERKKNPKQEYERWRWNDATFHGHFATDFTRCDAPNEFLFKLKCSLSFLDKRINILNVFFSCSLRIFSPSQWLTFYLIIVVIVVHIFRIHNVHFHLLLNYPEQSVVFWNVYPFFYLNLKLLCAATQVKHSKNGVLLLWHTYKKKEIFSGLDCGAH